MLLGPLVRSGPRRVPLFGVRESCHVDTRSQFENAVRHRPASGRQYALQPGRRHQARLLLDQRHATTPALHAELRVALRKDMAAADIARSRQPEPGRNAQVGLGGRDGGLASDWVRRLIGEEAVAAVDRAIRVSAAINEPPALRVRQLRSGTCVWPAQRK
jgi:hypothetical protein